FISMLAFQAPIAFHYDLLTTFTSLLIALVASLFAMKTLSHTKVRLHQYLLAAVWIGIGIALMHYVGMSAMRSQAQMYFASW
ncbi:MHYT domain-containing protein, partial [Pseudomonas bubulae]|uniref:MHYT domain-containing protein n=1 Tax=Pseudomonas bubulae TaxID=2316085 RepID=UPI002B1DEA47